MDQIDMGNPQPGQTLVPPPAKPEKKSPSSTIPRFSAQLRTFYFDRDKFDNSRSEAWALGGSLAYKSGYLADLFRVGAVVYTSQPLYAPDDRDGTLLLKPGQEGYTVLGQIYGEVKFTDRIFGAIGRKEYNTPYINSIDVRMTPNTFEGVTVYGTAGGKDGAPEWRVRRRLHLEDQGTEFRSSSSGCPATPAPAWTAACFVGGRQFRAEGFLARRDQLLLGRHHQYFLHGSQVRAAAGRTHSKLKLAAQFSDQRARATICLRGRHFPPASGASRATWAWARRCSPWPTRIPRTAPTCSNPWSGYPGYTSVQVQDFNRAGESAVMLKAAYDFSSHGAKGSAPMRSGCTAPGSMPRRTTKTRSTSISNGRPREARCGARRFGCAMPMSASGVAAIRRSMTFASS